MAVMNKRKKKGYVPPTPGDEGIIHPLFADPNESQGIVGSGLRKGLNLLKEPVSRKKKKRRSLLSPNLQPMG